MALHDAHVQGVLEHIGKSFIESRFFVVIVSVIDVLFHRFTKRLDRLLEGFSSWLGWDD